MNANVGFLADSLVYGPGYSFTVKSHNGTAISWHDAAQVRLVSFGLNEAKRFIGLFAGCRAVLLDPPVASLAKRDFHQGLTPCRLRKSSWSILNFPNCPPSIHDSEIGRASCRERV